MNQKERNIRKGAFIAMCMDLNIPQEKIEELSVVLLPTPIRNESKLWMGKLTEKQIENIAISLYHAMVTFYQDGKTTYNCENVTEIVLHELRSNSLSVTPEDLNLPDKI